MSRPIKIRKIGGIDRFSSLPDEIAHKIIWYFTPREKSLFSVVSKRCRQLCLSTPYLYVSGFLVKHSLIKQAQLMNYVDRLLILRESTHIKVFKIHKINISTEEQEYRLLSWLHKAVLSNVRVLEVTVLDMKEDSELTLPSTLLSCKSLESFQCSFNRGLCNVKIPSNLGFSSLKLLVLCCVRIDDSFFNWISGCCRCLEELQLVKTRGTKNITITSPSVKILTLLYPFRAIHLQVYAEKLQTISLVLCNDNTPEWTEPKLTIPNIHTFHKVLLNKTDSYTDLDELRSKPFSDISLCDITISCLYYFSTSLRCLRMFGDSVQRMAKRPFPPPQLPNVSEITLWMTRRNVEILSHMASFLNKTPNLQHLNIHEDDEADGNNETIPRGPDLKNFPVLPLLKDVKFVFPFTVEKRKLELIEYLINPSRKIEVNVICTPPMPYDVTTQLKGFQNATVNVILREFVSLDF